MLLGTLKNRLAMLSPSSLNRRHAYFAYTDPKTGRPDRIYLDTKYDANGRLYFVKSQDHDRLHARYEALLAKKFPWR